MKWKKNQFGSRKVTGKQQCLRACALGTKSGHAVACFCPVDSAVNNSSSSSSSRLPQEIQLEFMSFSYW